MEQATDLESYEMPGVLDNITLLRGMFNTKLFKESVRPMLYRKAHNDPEIVHSLTINLLKTHKFEMKMLSMFFKHRKELMINMNGKVVSPFGNAAGFDKNGDAIETFSNFFGFLEPGTVILNPRKGNDLPRIATDDKNLDIYNAQGFPSKGLEYFRKNLVAYRKAGGKATIYVNICGLPISDQDAVNVAMKEMEELLKNLNEYVDGFVWNPASPNTAALKLLKTPEIFEKTAVLMKANAPGKLLLVKMWPYEEKDKDTTMEFVSSFLKGGGHGVVVTNTVMVPKEQIPAPNWGYPTGGRSGKFLKPYRLRAVKDMRAAFPDSIIIATGGIYDGDDAYETFKAGANMLEGYTPYGFYGLGLLKEIERGVSRRLRQEGYANLIEMQATVKKGTIPK